ncbi:hypothetical protein V2J09_021540 [Rumex salicifolius]
MAVDVVRSRRWLSDGSLSRELLSGDGELGKRKLAEVEVVALHSVRSKVTSEMNLPLLEYPTHEEAPGVDGMHAIFYQKFWEVVGDSIVHFVQQWWEGTISLGEINITAVTLIPKIASLHPTIIGALIAKANTPLANKDLPLQLLKDL